MAKQIPVRQCIGCREMKPKTELVRIIRTPEGDVCLDKTGKMNGRGAYICQDISCFEKAVKSKGIDRALKLSVPQDVIDAISRELI